jgi:hypothetical protein
MLRPPRRFSHHLMRVMGVSEDDQQESFNPWSIVNLVFHHLAAQGLHPVLGGQDPGAPAAQLLRALGIEPAAEGDRQLAEGVRRELADLREAMFHDESEHR